MLAYLFVLLAVAVRFLPHTFHFTPVGAALLFFGAKRSRKEMWVPVLLLASSDIALNLFVYHYPIGVSTFVSTAWYAAAVLIGGLMKNSTSEHKFNLPVVAGGALASSTSFFVVSNLGVWAFSTMYPHTLAGLGTCFVMAIPFFRGTFASDMIYTLAIFAAPVAVEAVRRLTEPEGTAAA
ncbi:MAG: putative rane protein [Acidobacteriaceae bacterium]|nr:putative rane protein [Acidobacteriaceae bacterium]